MSEFKRWMNCLGKRCFEIYPIPLPGETFICVCGQVVKEEIMAKGIENVQIVRSNKQVQESYNPSKLMLGIVGHCPQCGSPIYGHAITSDDVPTVRRSCQCKGIQEFADTIKTK